MVFVTPAMNMPLTVIFAHAENFLVACTRG